MSEEKKIKILLIEDEQDIRESYLDMLNFIGLEADSAENGIIGLQKLEQSSFDIVMTDLNMPEMDGMETLRRIKKKNKEIEVIVITGFATIENAISAMKQGAFDYITKPVSFEHVKIVLNKCIQKIQSQRENVELRDSNAQLKSLNELKDKFITITNHELRTPMAVLRGYIDLLEMETSEMNNEEINEYMAIINNTLSEMMSMIDSMHDFSSLKNFILSNEKILFDINDLLNKIAKEHKVFFEQRSIDLKQEFNSRAIYVRADERMLRKAIRELLQNSLKYTKEGGQVVLSSKEVPNREQIFITVSDNGIGIPADKLDLIFEPFYEVQDVLHHSTSKTDFMGGGIGMGLSLVKEIAEANEGEVAVESTPGKGSTFTIILPRAQNEEEKIG